MTGKAVTLPGLTCGNVATESMTDSEAVQRTLENLMKIMSEFREANMRRKLNNCQKVRIQAYQHRGNYIEGDKVWFQPLNGNAWLGLAAVVFQRGQSVYLHTHSNLKKIAACRVKPFKLLYWDEESASTKEVMLEDGLENVENLYTYLKDDFIDF